MNVLVNVILAAQILAALAMVGLILIQHGKGADMGAAFGSGSSGSLFGASGSANFLSRTTSVLAATFFAATLALAYFGGVRPGSTGSVLEGAAVTTPAPITAPTSTPNGTAAGSIPAGSDMPAPATPIPSSSAPVVPATGAGQIPTK